MESAAYDDEFFFYREENVSLRLLPIIGRQINSPTIQIVRMMRLFWAGYEDLAVTYLCTRFGHGGYSLFASFLREVQYT